MKKVRFLPIILILALLLSLPCQATPEETEATELTSGATEEVSSEPADTAPAVTIDDVPTPLKENDLVEDFAAEAGAAALIEINTGTLIYGKDIDKKIYPASLTKIMTCMLALEYGDLDDVLTVSATALENLSEYGSTAGLVEGEQLSLRELLYCIMVSSANEGCNVIAEHISGSVDKFVELMNQTAAALGMTGTHYKNTHGLHDEEHYTTVRDLSVVARWAWSHDSFREFATATTHVVPATNKSEERNLHTTNYLTSNSYVTKYYYSKAQGIKTGFTTPAGGCLISTADEGSISVMTIVTGCSTDYDENGEVVDTRFVETRRMMEYALEHFSHVQVLSDTVMVDMPSVRYAKGRGNVVVRAAENVSVLLPDTVDTSKIIQVASYDGELVAPLEAGQRVGTVSAIYEGEVIATCDLVTITAVERSEAAYQAEQTQQAVEKTTNKLLRHWYFTFPVLILLVLAGVILIIRGVNIRRAKKRRARRQREQERRRRHE